jgi:hypothetical protein
MAFLVCTCIRTYVRTYVRTYIQNESHQLAKAYLLGTRVDGMFQVNMYIHTYIYTHIHTLHRAYLYIHTRNLWSDTHTYMT